MKRFRMYLKPFLAVCLPAALSVAVASCDGDAAVPPAAAPGAQPVETPAAARTGLLVQDVSGRIETNIDPQRLAFMHSDLIEAGRLADAERLSKSYDFKTGLVHERVMPGRRSVSESGVEAVSKATTIYDPSFVYSCETYVTCTGSWIWETCTNPLYGCRPWFEPGQIAGMKGYPLRHIGISDRPSTPPSGNIAAPTMWYTFFRGGAWTPWIQAGSTFGWANAKIEAFAVWVDNPAWTVGYQVWSTDYNLSLGLGKWASNGQAAGTPNSGQFIQQYNVSVYRFVDGGGID
jgi:hypothetical protein